MELEKQRLLLSCLIADRDLFALCAGLIQPTYFDPSLRKAVRFALEYFQRYKEVPRAELIRAETGVLLEAVDRPTRAEAKYVAGEVETFCRNKAIEEAILRGPELLQRGDYGKILETLKAAIGVVLQRDIGTDYFADPEARLRATLEQNPLISTGWPELDAMIGGGLGRQELILFLANSGGGKSMTMLNLGKNLLAQGLNGIYISLEMGESIVSKRLDSMITGVAQDALLKNLNKVAAAITEASPRYGRLFIKRLPENRTNVHHVRAYIERLEQDHGLVPDFIIIDYIDIMGTTHSISLDNLFTKDKYVAEEVRSLGFDFNCIMISASQLGRSAIEADELNQGHIQGGISKINTSDYVIAVRQDELMRAQGEIAFTCLKSRNAGGQGWRALLRWDPVSLNISSLRRDKSDIRLKPKSTQLINDSQTVNKPGDGASIIDLIQP